MPSAGVLHVYYNVVKTAYTLLSRHFQPSHNTWFSVGTRKNYHQFHTLFWDLYMINFSYQFALKFRKDSFLLFGVLEHDKSLQ